MSIKFKSNEEGKCPICNSDNLDYDSIDLLDGFGECCYPWHCNDCGADGKEYYNMEFSEVIANTPDGDMYGDDEGVCPECGGPIQYGLSYPEGNGLGYEYTCEDCGGQGYEWYNLEFTTHDNVEEGKPLDENKELKAENVSYTDLVRAGEDLWRDGAVIRETRVDGIYDCSTAGHGGYLVDTDVHPELAKYGEKTYIDNIVGFEEDYEALKVIWAYPEVLEKIQLNSDWYSKLTLDDVLRYEDRLNDEFRREFPNKKSIETPKEMKTEAEMNINDMYDDYRKAYHKELDVKRVPCVIARDTLMSGWGMAEGKKHYQVVLCADNVEAHNIAKTMQSVAEDEGLANIRTSFGIQLPRGASVSYNIGRYASAWNMDDSWYEKYDLPIEKKEEAMTSVEYDATENALLKEIFRNLQNGRSYGKDVTNVTYPYFDDVLYLVWNDKGHTEKAIGWSHYGSSANKNTVEDLKWILDNIFEMKPSEFLARYKTDLDTKLNESKHKEKAEEAFVEKKANSEDIDNLSLYIVHYTYKDEEFDLDNYLGGLTEIHADINDAKIYESMEQVDKAIAKLKQICEGSEYDGELSIDIIKLSPVNVETKSILTKGIHPQEEYDDGDTNWVAEQESEADERMEARYGNVAESKELKTEISQEAYKDLYNKIKDEPRTENYTKGLKLRDEIVDAWKNKDLKTAYKKWSDLFDLFSTGYDDAGNQTADWSEEQSLRDMIELTSITDTIEDKCVYDVTDYGKAKAYKGMGY